ncbi:MAG: tetratricopeptide repeat protein [Bryobacteraceae bacterium]
MAGAMSLRGQQMAGYSPGGPQIEKSPERMVVFSGSVMLDDGSPPADRVSIERVCDGRTTFEAWTNEHGQFAFKVGARDALGAGDDSVPINAVSNVNAPLSGSSTQYSMPITSMLKNCELQAALPGYRSERVSMAMQSVMDDARMGTIILYPISGAAALTVSATSLAAPAKAKKDYVKGLAAMRMRKWEAAAAAFSEAVALYPRYAMAWYLLGVAQQNRNDPAGAVDAWKHAQRSDPRYVNPYEALTAAADKRGDWAESEKYAGMWIKLDTEDFPSAYLYSAVANARMDRLDEAERAARQGLHVDRQENVPRLNYVLGLILMEKKQYAESVKRLRHYVELSPNGGDSAAVRQQLPRIEELAAATKP